MASRKGFTVVELLIVIVVIGILATLSIIAYSGVQNQARASTLQSDLEQAAKKLEQYKFNNAETYPSTLSDIKTLAGVKETPSNTMSYTYNSTTRRFCLTNTNASGSYFISSTQLSPVPGSCDGLVAWVPLNNNVDDYGINNLTTINYGATTSSGQNTKSGSYTFNGTSNRIDIIYNSVLNTGQPAMTLTAWFNPTTLSGTRAIVNRNSPYIIWQSADSISTGMHNGSNWFWANSAAGTVTSGNWQFVALVYDGTYRNVYKNDQKVVTNDAQISGNIVSNATTINIGNDNCCARYYFQGSIDDVRVYNRALTDVEIKNMYAAGAF